jgi:hypothetical protein
MPMNKKQWTELIFLGIFFVAAICKFLIMPYAALIVAISGFLLGGLYFYFAFWLYADTGIALAIRIIVGLIYSINIVAFMYCLLKWPFWRLYGIISYVTLGIILITCLFNYRALGYRSQLYRCILFIVTLSIVYCYRSFHP